MAAGWLIKALGPDRERVEVISAGTGALEGRPATGPAIETAGRDGVDLTGHRSRRLTPELMRTVDLALVMEPAHLAVVSAMGAKPDRTHLLSEWPPPGEPQLVVDDPYGGSLEAYEECWRRIRRHVDRVVPLVREALRERSA
jgi:protein-tyrosine-phosphatase